MAEINSDILQTLIDEFKVLSPEITNATVFNDKGQIIATAKKTTSQDQEQNLITNFGTINGQAKLIGGIENLTIQASTSQLNITAMTPLFLATVFSRKANPEIIKSLTQVVVPTAVSLINQNSALLQEKSAPSALGPEKLKEPTSPIEEDPESDPIPEPKLPFEAVLPQTPRNQFMVEKISGFLVASDTVRIDGKVIATWFGLFEGKKITLVNIETLEGRKTVCKFKPINETKPSAKGIIQIPEKILQALQTDKGKLVMVKPVIDQSKE